jgi:hypothetical protein
MKVNDKQKREVSVKLRWRGFVIRAFFPVIYNGIREAFPYVYVFHCLESKQTFNKHSV